MGCQCLKDNRSKTDSLTFDIVIANNVSNINSNDEFQKKVSSNSRKEKLANRSHIEVEDILSGSHKSSFEADMKTNYVNMNPGDKNILGEMLLAEINKARTNPAGYVEKVKKYKKQIKSFYSDNPNFNRTFLSIDANTSICLIKGMAAFDECIEYLTRHTGLNLFPLVMNDDLKVAFPEDKPEMCSKKEYLTREVTRKAMELREKYERIDFHYDQSVSNAELSCVLQVVDDTDSNCHRRRNIFNPRCRYVGINYGKVKGNIYCFYLMFADRKGESPNIIDE